MKNKSTLIIILIVLVSLGLGFGGGYFFRNDQINRTRLNLAGRFNGQFPGGTGVARGMGNGQGGQRGFGGLIIGEVISRDDNSITVKVADGSVTATSVQLNPEFLNNRPSPTPTPK